MTGMTDLGARPRIVRRFCRNKPALAGSGLVLLFFLLAVFAPFLAGSRPLILVDEQGLSLPVFAGFDAGDFLWLSGLGITIAVWGLGKVQKRRGKSADAARFWLGLLLAAAAVSVAFLWPQKLDRFDADAFDGNAPGVRFCLMPPVPHAPADFDFAKRSMGPGPDHWLGTDGNGRDVLSRLIHGTRISILVGLVAVSIYVLIGVVAGALAGYFGGLTDLLMGRLIEIVICVPVFFAILAVFSFLPPSIFLVMFLIGLFRWPHVARLTRAEFLRLRKEEFVIAARALGVSNFRIIFSQMLPNSLGPVIVAATFGIAGAILLESGLSFLGFGVQPPTPSWGQMLAQARGNLIDHWWLALFPGLAIFLATLAFNLVGEGLRDAIDPKVKR